MYVKVCFDYVTVSLFLYNLKICWNCVTCLVFFIVTLTIVIIMWLVYCLFDVLTHADLIYTAQNNYVCTRLFALFDVLNWTFIKTHVYDLKACPIPYPMVGKTIFVTTRKLIINNVTASQPVCPLLQKLQRWTYV